MACVPVTRSLPSGNVTVPDVGGTGGSGGSESGELLLLPPQPYIAMEITATKQSHLNLRPAFNMLLSLLFLVFLSPVY
jgi:hypothetical protein